MDLIVLIFKIASIGAGILLGITALDRLDGESNFFNNIAKKIMPFSTIIGGAVLGLGIFFLLFYAGDIIYELIAIFAGILLLTHVLSQLPTVGDAMVKISKALMPFKVIVGIGLLVLTILRLFHIHLL